MMRKIFLDMRMGYGLFLGVSTQVKRASSLDEKRRRTDGSSQHRADVGWGEPPLSSLSFCLLFQIEDLVVKSILCGLTSLKEEMNTGQKKEVFSSLAPAASINMLFCLR